MGPECGRAPPPHKWRETYADVQSPDAVTRAFPVATQITGKNAMAHLFISHSSRDGAAIAQPLVSALESVGHRCWIAPHLYIPPTFVAYAANRDPVLEAILAYEEP